MTDAGFKRKLTAIFSADVAGYSRLMSEDEAATVKTLEAYKQIMFALIKQHRGRVIDSPGDNLLSEFTSVMDAVQCGLAIQKELQTHNADLPETRKMWFRIGINLGDVIEEGNRIYGDGVNIAARLEGLSEAGGICISDAVYDQIENKIDLQYESLGEQSVKNIHKPIRAYRIRMEPKKRSSHPIRGLPNKPSIAVLPFVNMSDDPEQEYFSDGITEDLITDLSKITGLFVIARNSVFTYKNKPVIAQKVGQELGIRYLLEGSVRKSGDRIRITTQFIDALTGGHLWAERYDRNMGDIFAIQDELTQRIIAVLSIKLGEEEHKRLAKRGTVNIAAYDFFLRGIDFFNQYTKEANLKARSMFQHALDLDAHYAMAYEKMGWTFFMEWSMGWSDDSRCMDHAFGFAEKAVAIDDSFEGSHCLLGSVHLWKKQHDKAIALYEKSLRLNPNHAIGYCDLGDILCYAGKPKEAVALIQKGMQLDPFFPYHYWFLGHAYLLSRRHDEALNALDKALGGNPDFFPARAFRAVAFVEKGLTQQAQNEIALILKKNPGITIDIWRERLPYKNPEDLERILTGLRKAGMP